MRMTNVAKNRPARLHPVGVTLLMATAFIAPLSSHQEPTPATAEASSKASEADDATNAEIEQMLDTLYEAFCFDAKGEADWDGMRAVFADGATFVSPIRDGAPAKGVDADRFVKDFKDWCLTGSIRKTGLYERITHTRVDHFNNVGHAYVTFEGYVPGEEKRRTFGLDCLQLIRDSGQWKVISFTSQYTNDKLPMPERFVLAEHARK